MSVITGLLTAEIRLSHRLSVKTAPTISLGFPIAKSILPLADFSWSTRGLSEHDCQSPVPSHHDDCRNEQCAGPKTPIAMRAFPIWFKTMINILHAKPYVVMVLGLIKHIHESPAIRITTTSLGGNSVA